MKKSLILLSGVLALSAFGAKLPVDEDIFLQKYVSFVCDRHKEQHANIIRPAEKDYPFPDNKIIWDKGMPVIMSGNDTVTMFTGQLMSATGGNPISARRLYEAGVNTFVVDVSIAHSKWMYSRKYPRTSNPEVTFKNFARNANALLKSAPNAKIILRIWASYECDEYAKLYPDALLADPKGNTVWKNKEQRSNYMTEWKLYIGERLRKLLELIGDSPLASHLVGVTIGAGNTGEWWYYKDGRFYWDYSKTRQEGFKNYLYAKYGEEKFPELIKRYNAKNKEDLFRLPTAKERRTPGVRPNTRVADYNQVLNYPMTNGALYFAKIIKTVSKGKLLAGAEILTGLNTMNVNGNVFVNHLINSPDFDFFNAPSPYPLRHAGGYSPNRAVNASLHLHKKMFIAEEDFRPHSVFGTPQGLSGRPAPTPNKTAQQFRRQATAAMLKGHGGYMMEFGANWFIHPVFTKELTRNLHMRDIVRKFGSERNMQVAVVSDVESQLYGNYFATPTELRDSVLPFIGVDYDFYELSDFIKPGVYDKYKLVIFLNTRALGDRERAGIDKIKGNNRSLVFLYDAGAVDLTNDNPNVLANAEKLTSIKMVNRKAKSKWGNVILNANEPNMQKYLGLSGKKLDFGVRRQVKDVELSVVDPVSFQSGTNLCGWSPNDPKAINLATSADGGVRFAMKQNKDWLAYYCSGTSLPANIIRAIAVKAGCHVKNFQGDVVFERGEFTSVHTAFKGKHVVHFPSSDEVLECFSGQKITPVNNKYEFEADRGMTYLFYQGPDGDKITAELASMADAHEAWRAEFSKNNLAPKAIPGYLNYLRNNARPKRNGPFAFSSFRSPAFLVAGPFADFDEVVNKMASITEIKRMAKEPPLLRSERYDTLGWPLKVTPVKSLDTLEWRGYHGYIWQDLIVSDISKGQTGLFAYYVDVPKDSEALLMFAPECPAVLMINNKVVWKDKEIMYQKYTFKKGLNLVMIAAQNDTGTAGFTLKYFNPKVPRWWNPVYWGTSGKNYEWKDGRVYLGKPVPAAPKPAAPKK